MEHQILTMIRSPTVDINDDPWDWDNDGVQNENDSYMVQPRHKYLQQVELSNTQTKTQNRAPECTLRESHSLEITTIGDGINNGTTLTTITMVYLILGY